MKMLMSYPLQNAVLITPLQRSMVEQKNKLNNVTTNPVIRPATRAGYRYLII